MKHTVHTAAAWVAIIVILTGADELAPEPWALVVRMTCLLIAGSRVLKFRD